MTFQHAVVWTDHQSAQVLQFDAESFVSSTVRQHSHPTGQHGSGVRAEHEFYAQVCDTLQGIGEVLVVGSHTALADFRHYVEKHRAATAKRLVAYQVVDHLTEKQLLAHARTYFAEKIRLGE